jgi:hypothetical protein
VGLHELLQLNAGLPLEETSSNVIGHAEMVTIPSLFDRIYVELGTFSATDFATDVDILIPRYRRPT